MIIFFFNLDEMRILHIFFSLPFTIIGNESIYS